MSEETKTHGELVAAGLRDECDLRGLISESHNCIDCGYDTNPGCPNRAEAEQMIAEQRAREVKKWRLPQRYSDKSEAFFVHDHVWKAAGMTMEWSYSGEGSICIGCLEKRIGRRLQPFDFIQDHPFNDPNLPGTRPRFERLIGAETLESLEDEPAPMPATKLDQALHAALGGKQWRAA
jgi:hypothetical protein